MSTSNNGPKAPSENDYFPCPETKVYNDIVLINLMSNITTFSILGLHY